MKKLLSALLALVMLVSVFTVSAFAIEPGDTLSVNDFYFTEDGTNCAKLDDNTLTLKSGYAATTVELIAGVDEDASYYTITVVSSTLPEEVGVAIDDVYELDAMCAGSSYAFADLFTIPAGLTKGEYTVTFDIYDEINGEDIGNITLTVVVPCSHANSYVIGAKAATFFSKGFTGVTYCADCNEVLDAGSVIPCFASTPAAHHAYACIGHDIVKTVSRFFK